MIWLVSFLMTFAHAKSRATKIESCAGAAKDAKLVQVYKQWHLPGSTITKGFKEKYPHEKNQTAIYQALNEAIKKKKVDLVLAEGCEGEINQEFAGTFNGWDIESLSKQSQTRGFERIITNVPLKLEARHGQKVQTFCGDSDALIQEGNLRLSNLRGWLGFWTRLNETTDEERLKLYAGAAADLLKIPKDTPVDQIRAKVRAQIADDLTLFQKSLADRNAAFVATLKDKTFKTAAIVIGGLHAKDLKDKLQAAGYACEILEPKGYAREDENLIKDFQKILATTGPTQ